MALRNVDVHCWLRYQHSNIQRGDEMILSAISNGPWGTTIGVFQEDDNPNGQSYLRMIGTIDARDSERINHTARAQQFGGQPRGGPRIGSRFCPDIVSAVVSPFSPQYINTYPPNYGLLPPGGPTRRPHVILRVTCRT